MQYNTGDTICAIATPEGVGAIGIIRISGTDAITITNELFKGKNLTKVNSHTAHFGSIVTNQKTLDEVVATVFVEPKSYTGENTVEISCHGSPYILGEIIKELVNKGCRLAQPGEFTLRAFVNKKLDLSQAEAVADLISSNSAKSHETALNQMRGGYSMTMMQMREQLINFASLIELELDFAEEDVEFANRTELIALVNKILSEVNNLMSSFAYGNAIKNGIPTVIVGKPNAGKSTLLNALLNDERAIVSDIAGTTRDSIEETFTLDGIIFRLIDTAGIRAHASDDIESIGIERTLKHLSKASIIIYLFDAATSSKEEVIGELNKLKQHNGKVIAVANKVEESVINPLPDEAIAISAKLNTGLHSLKEELISIVREAEVNNDVIITNLRHYEALKQTAEALQSVLNAISAGLSGELVAFDIRKALHHLGEITGTVTTDDLLANIFSKFCIGK